MTADWIKTVLSMNTHGPVVRVAVIRAEGSTPRDAGAFMLVTSLGQSGTIGGGALEFDAIKAARCLLDETEGAGKSRWVREVREYPLGPALCQCCGGFAWVLFEVFADAECAAVAAGTMARGHGATFIARHLRTGAPVQFVRDRRDLASLSESVAAPLRSMLSGAEPARAVLIEGGPSEPAWFIEPLVPPLQTLYLYGAGHVGREVVRVTEGLGFGIVWIDTDATRFPATIPSHARAVVASDPVDVARTAEPHAFHLVMTYAHPIDEAICRTLLRRHDIAFLGLIGSDTKRARFASRLKADGLTDAELTRLISPIGIDGLTGKAPSVIAISVAAQLLMVRQQLTPATDSAHAVKSVANSGELAQLSP
jgi:xanthine dehydrogenase accessory factor